MTTTLAPSRPVPAQLIVGSSQQTLAFVESLLQKKLCPLATPGCFCSVCRKLKAHQQHNVIWISPEKGYTVDDVDVIFQRTAFQLDDNEECFFILEKAQTLTSAAANRLLKVLEEPPRGYNFILLTDNQSALLPTIVSRCLVTTLEQGASSSSGNPLLMFFALHTSNRDPFALEQELKKQHLSESQSSELLYDLINQYIEHLKQASDDSQREHIQTLLDYLLTQAKRPPQAGSSELFWKNLFLSWPSKR